MPRALLLSAFAVNLFLHAAPAVGAQEEMPVQWDRFGDPLPTGVLARLGTVRFNRCSCAAYSPDGKIIVTADRDGTHVWEAATGKKIRKLPAEDWPPVALIFSHDRKKLAVLGWGGASVQVWDMATFKKVVLTQPDGGSAGGDWSSAAAFSSDDKTLVAATYAKLFVWDLAAGKKLKEFPFLVGGKRIDVRMIAFSEDGKIAATQGSEKVHLWDTQTGNQLHEIPLLRGGDVMKFSRDGKSLVVTGYGHWLSIFNVATGKKANSLAVSAHVVSVAFSTDGKTLAAASNETIGSSSTEGNQVVQLWDLANLKTPREKFPAPGVHSVMFSPDGKTLAWGCHGQTLCFMDRATGKDRRPTASHRGAIKALVYLPDGKRIVSASEDGAIRIWDAATSESLTVLHGHVGEILGLALYPNGKLLASCGRDGSFRLWDIDHGKALAVLKDEGNSVRAAAFSVDGTLLASGGHRGLAFLRDPANGKILEEFETESIASLAFSPDGKTLAALGDHGRGLRVLNLVTKKAKQIPIKGGGSSVAYSPDGKILAVACDGDLLLLDAASHAVLRRLPGHANSRGCVVFAPDGRYLASVSDGWGGRANRSIRVFEMATGTEIHSFKKELPIFAAAFSPDGSKLVVGGADATAVILDLKNLTGQKRRAQLTEAELVARWKDLAAADAGAAYEAHADLLHAPTSAVPFLAKRLPPAPVIDAKRIASLIKNLDSNTFKVRAQAFKELDDLGDLVRAPLQMALAGNTSTETRRRLATLLAKLDQLTPSQLRHLRAIEILDVIGTPEAFGVLERLTQGNPDGIATAESRLIFARKQKNSASLPPNPIARKDPVADIPPPGPIRADRDGDAMPAGAIARLGSGRWRLTNEPHRILVSADGKKLAVVNSFSGYELLDSQTGKNIERARTGFYNWGFDLRMAVALSPDWRKLAALEGGDRSLTVFDQGKPEKVKIEYGRKKDLYPVLPEEVESGGGYSWGTSELLSATDFSPDGRTLVGAVRFEWECRGSKVNKELKETHIIAWDAATGKEIWKSLTPVKTIHTIFSWPDGKTISVVDRTGIGFWDAAKGRELRRWPSKDPLFSARFSLDRHWLATGSKGEILLWEVAAGKVRRRLALAGKEIRAIAFSPDGKLLAGGGDKSIRFWDPVTGKVKGDCSVFPNAVEAVAFSGDGKTLFSGHQNENILRRWDVASRQPIGEITGPIAPVRMLSFSPDSRTIQSSTDGDDLYLWETATGKPCPLPKKSDERYRTDWLASSGQTALLRCEEGFGTQFAMLLTGKIDRLDQIPGFLGSSVDGRRVLVQSEKAKKPCLTVLKVDGANAKDQDKRKDDIEREFVWDDGDALSAALSPDGKTVAAAGKDVICFLDVATGHQRRYDHSANVKADVFFRAQSVKFAADGSRIALVGAAGQIRVLAVKDGRRIADFVTRSRYLTTGLAFAPDGQTLLTTSLNAPVFAWEVATGQMVRRLKAATYLYSPDNRLLAGSADTLKIFDLYSGRTLRVCQAEGNALGNFAFSPDSRFLAASYADTTILVWPSTGDVNAGQPLLEKDLAQILEKGAAPEAYEVIGRMIAHPDRALAFLERRLHAVPAIDARHVQQLISDLDSNQSKRRELALKELARLGPLIEPALRTALSIKKTPLATQEQIAKLLSEINERQTTISAEDVLHIRAIQVLERIGTQRARQMLENLAPEQI